MQNDNYQAEDDAVITDPAGSTPSEMDTGSIELTTDKQVSIDMDLYSKNKPKRTIIRVKVSYGPIASN